MNKLSKIVRTAVAIMRSGLFSPAELAELGNMVNTVTVEDLNYNAEEVVRYSLSLARSKRLENGRATPPPPVVYTEIYSNDHVTVCIFCVPAGCEIPLHDHPAMYGFMKVIHGRCLVEAYSPVDGGDLRPPCSGAIAVTMHPAFVLRKEDPAAKLTPSSHCYHRVRSTDCSVAFFDVLFPPYRFPHRDCHYFSVLNEADDSRKDSVIWLKPTVLSNYWGCDYPYRGEPVSIAPIQ